MNKDLLCDCGFGRTYLQTLHEMACCGDFQALFHSR